MKKAPWILPLTLLFFVIIPTAKGVEYQSPRTLSLGGAGRAAPWLTDSIFLNPSFNSFNPVYSLSGAWLGFNGGRNYNVSVQDARNELFQAGVGYTVRESSAALNIGASKAFVNKYSVGIGSKVIIDSPSKKTTTDLIFSSSWLAAPWIYGSLVIDNLIEGPDQRSRNLYRTLFIPLKIVPVHKVDLYFDPSYTPSYSAGPKIGYSTGIEIGMLQDLALRLGRFVDAEVAHLGSRGSGFGYGVAWYGPKLGLEYSVSRTLSLHSGGDGGIIQGGGFSVFF